ncbi:MAG: serine protease [Myxococcota bacterium]
MYGLIGGLLSAALAVPPAPATDALDVDLLADSPDADVPDLGHRPDDASTQVVGGAPSAPGSWPSTVAVLFGGQPGCTGTLVAPNVVITAAHCVTPEAPNAVRTGSVDARQGGQVLQIANATFHPTYDGYEGVDIAVLQLASPSNAPTTTIATDCVGSQSLYDGGPAMIVGFGSTNPAGTQYPDVLYEASSSIRDADCSQDVLSGYQTTCESSLRPTGELVAGGNGVDSCYGDSGGPLYVPGTDGAWYLAGVTSRGFAAQDCGSGGVYVRPDTYIGWVESIVGPLPRPVCGGPDVQTDTPEPPPVEEPDDTQKPDVTGDLTISSDLMVLRKNRLGALELTAEGAVGALEWEIVTGPATGHAHIDQGVLYFSPELRFTGDDVVVVSVRDELGNEAQQDVAIAVMGSGCDQSGGAPFGLSLLAMLGVLARRGRS